MREIGLGREGYCACLCAQHSIKQAIRSADRSIHPSIVMIDPHLTLLYSSPFTRHTVRALKMADDSTYWEGKVRC